MKTLQITKEILINSIEYEELFGNSKSEEMIKLNRSKVFIKAKEMVEDILWDMLFTSVGDYLRCIYITDMQKKTISVEFNLEIGFFMKHFGCLVHEQYQKQMVRLIVNIKRAMAWVNWVELVRDGKEKRDWNKRRNIQCHI